MVLEDAVAGVEAAKAGGMKCIAVRFVGHHSEESLRKAGADLVATIAGAGVGRGGKGAAEIDSRNDAPTRSASEERSSLALRVGARIFNALTKTRLEL